MNVLTTSILQQVERVKSASSDQIGRDARKNIEREILSIEAQIKQCSKDYEVLKADMQQECNEVSWSMGNYLAYSTLEGCLWLVFHRCH